GTENIANARLFASLRLWRNSKAAEMNVPAYVVLQQKALLGISETLPENIAALTKVKGVGKAIARRYGADIVEIVRQYKKENGMQVDGDIFDGIDELEKKPAKAPKVDTKEVTWQMFTEGMSVDEIAKTRGLVISTIVNHLSHYVAQGQLEPSDIIAPERAETIANYLKNNPQHSLTTVREALNNEFSYDEIRLVMAWVRRGI
ncbi:MAG: helix-turn-helix domain-containing protein, partial [Salinivirgaceae bacterium]|nr:helix-turn-helix domain-containing protein [Salinivirgaceae bacterium]